MRIELCLILALAVGLAAVGWKSLRLERELMKEQVVHAQTQTALAAALTEGQRWRTVAAEHLIVADAQKGALESCLARESQAQTDAQARKNILNSAKPRPRPETETRQVVDDETRIRAASRLNRDL